MTSNLPSFVLPQINNNQSSWGPNCQDLTSKLDDSLFQPYSKDNKSERHWKISDWSLTNKARGRHSSAPGTGLFSYKNEDDESSFNYVDSKLSRNKGYMNKKPVGTHRTYVARPQNKYNQQRTNYKTNPRTKFKHNFRRFQRDDVPAEPSIPIKATWELIQTIQFKEIPVSIASLPTVTTVKEIGSLPTFDSSYNNFDIRRPRPVLPTSLSEFDVTTSSDPTISSFVEAKEANIYATESILSLLMASTFTIAPWDLLVNKTDKGLFIDKRPDSNVSKTIVHESSNDILPTEADNINSAAELMEEATSLASSFISQVFKKPTAVSETPGPANSLPVLHRYRDIDFGNINVLVRTSVHGQSESNELIKARMLNEFDSKLLHASIDWRSKFESQSGAILAAEIKNNTSRVIRIVGESLLSGASSIKLGYITRTQPRDNTKHDLLRVESHTPSRLSEFLRLSLRSFWATLKYLLEELESLPIGKYVLLRDPTATEMKIYKVPDTTFNDVTGEVSHEVDHI